MATAQRTNRTKAVRFLIVRRAAALHGKKLVDIEPLHVTSNFGHRL
jgi:hypothetical protein